ncbi:hypothetical protein DIGNKC_235 [Bacillus phage DIGNKC]|uniref:hypothetical protein n=1 Tax=Bacillus phage DIGNKC TaxID=1805948 RepID=UPI0007A773F5|nr:hypothetical protein BI007_gp139 [Bacillus phage DIGNKC]AMW62810.1 hypothetical protein DIGNKC_235 [Bacillus phage DIGNKC]
MAKMYIPDKLKVGFQSRSDTYSGKLSYITYYDEKGVLRKENSWKGWIREELGIMELDNVPTEGFVINRSGGGVPKWSERKAFIRVWHPEGFEFEIDLDNLMFILAHCSVTKGKGIEGKLILAWEGQQLYLLPVESDVYQTMSAYSTVIKKLEFVEPKDLKIGYTYIDTKNQEEWVYLGRFTKYSYPSNSSYGWKDEEQRRKNVYGTKAKQWFFAKKYSWSDKEWRIVTRSNVKNFFCEEADWGCVQDFTPFQELLDTSYEASEVKIWEPEYYEIDVEDIMSYLASYVGYKRADSFAFHLEGDRAAECHYRVERRQKYQYTIRHKDSPNEPEYEYAICKTRVLGGHESMGCTYSLTENALREKLANEYKPYALLVRHASGKPYKVYGGSKEMNKGLAEEVGAESQYR